MRSILLPVLLLAVCAQAVTAQEDESWRVGVTVGGASFVGLVVEYRRDATAAELGLGTWALRDVSLSLSGKYYAGRAAVSPYAGLGLWSVIARPEGGSGERTGLALLLRAPVGIDVGVADHHAIGLEIGLTRALAIRRPDPEDDLPLARRIVPLPGMYYKVGRTP
jgi:hypothetical protein